MMCDDTIFIPGRLLFLLCDGTPFSEAIVSASAPELRLDHVGVIDRVGGTTVVIEANSQKGVVATPLADFLNRAPLLEGDAGWRIRRLPDDADVDIEAALERARKHIGKQYNWRFLPSPGALYCSELVQRCFLRSDGSPFFRDISMDFNCDSAQAAEFWKKHFDALQMTVPQNQPGTSPLSIYDSTIEI